MKRVLVVDDEPTIRELIADFLRESGCHVDTAANGAEALRLMEQQLPHVIVLDLMMPRLDGYGFVATKRRDPRFSQVPIVLMTAAFGAVEVAEHLGAHACLPKPFELDELVDMVDRLVDNPMQMLLSSAAVGTLQDPVVAEP
jgi:CheY-like chemotaxis protein